MKFLVCIAACVFVVGASPQRGGQGDTEREVGISKVQEVFAWKQMTFNIDGNSVSTSRFGGPVANGDNGESWVFPDEDQEAPLPDAEAPASGNNGDNNPRRDDFFIQYNNVPMGVDRWKNKLFVAIPRRRLGVPSTLNYVDLNENKNNKSPDLRPYPDFASNLLTNTGPNKPLVSVYRTRVDECDRLWAVDNGILDVTGNRRTIQPPAIVVFDLNTDKLIHRYELKADDDYLYNDASGFASITVDVSKSDCSNAYAYLTDLTNFGMVVYSLKENKSWRVYHNYFYPDPEEGDFNLNGVRFQWNDGLFSIALGPRQPDGFRIAYIHAMASQRERSVSTAVLRNETLASRTYHGTDFKPVGDKGPRTQTTMHDIQKSSQTMFMNLVGKNALACWNMRKPLVPKNIGIVAQHNTLFVYPSDMKIDSQDNIWVITNRLPYYLYRELDVNEVNFRIYKVSVKDAIAGTVCV